ncbi:ATP-binding protein [Actinophytocola sp.]|uniref:ATP-binding protein n=1 Tax=Actinophytocola sp. TaxID=1872138 RepID=UPI002D7E6397|nr:tetratricopeptide repeat protein [Actinophytocola sp.]HET9137907.1 tetratricopeptide repeat protein [Actinophytocola sp.]
MEGFGDRRRTNAHQVAVRRALYQVLRKAFGRAGVPWSDCDREDRGDGVFVLVPAQVPKSRVVDTLPYELAEVVRRHNVGRPAAERIRLRVAVHAGEVVYDEHGVTGSSINLAFRLLDAQPLREALTSSPGTLAMIVSSWFFDEVVRHSVVVDPARYRPVYADVKETATRAWIHLPDGPATDRGPVDLLLDRTGPVPRQLPPTLRDFTGRADQLAALDALLPAIPADGSGDVVIVALDGAAGVGKTTLAVQWAHRVQHRFPDGTLFTDLRGHGPSAPLAPGLVLASFLHALGVPDSRTSADLDTQVGTYRSVLAGRRVLIVLDNAAMPAQVRPLLPAAAGSMVVVTSRVDLTGLVVAEAAHRMVVDLFTQAEAETLIRKVVGAELAAAQPDAVADLIAACAGLPLALRVACTRISSRSSGIAELVAGLSDAQGRLAALSSTGDDRSAVRTVFDWSYSRLPAEFARTFRRLGLHVGPGLSVHAGAALAGVDPATAGRHLEALADIHLIARAGPDRYRLHELLFAYAGHRAELDDAGATRRQAVVNLLTWYARTAQTADRLIFPGLGYVDAELDPAGSDVSLASRSQALAWMNAERDNLMAALRVAIHHQAHQVAICLAGTARFLTLGGPAFWDLRLEAESLGLAAAQASGNLSMAAFLRGFRGDTLADLGRLGEAEAEFDTMLGLARDLNDLARQRTALIGLGQVRLRSNEYLAARSHFQQALTLARSTGDARAEAVVRCNLSRISVHLGQFDSALEHAQQELVLRRQAGDRVGEAYALQDLAAAQQGLHDHEAAIDLLESAIELYRHLDGTELYAALALQAAAASFEQTGDLSRAASCLREASALLTQLGHPQADVVHTRLRQLESSAHHGFRRGQAPP